MRKDKNYVPTVRINGQETVDTGNYFAYMGDSVIDIEIAKHNISRFIYRYTKKNSNENISPITSLILNGINDELYRRALLWNKPDSVNYIIILANRISSSLSLCGVSHSLTTLIDFLEEHKR